MNVPQPESAYIYKNTFGNTIFGDVILEYPDPALGKVVIRWEGSSLNDESNMFAPENIKMYYQLDRESDGEPRSMRAPATVVSHAKKTLDRYLIDEYNSTGFAGKGDGWVPVADSVRESGVIKGLF